MSERTVCTLAVCIQYCGLHASAMSSPSRTWRRSDDAAIERRALGELRTLGLWRDDLRHTFEIVKASGQVTVAFEGVPLDFVSAWEQQIHDVNDREILELYDIRWVRCNTDADTRGDIPDLTGEVELEAEMAEDDEGTSTASSEAPASPAPMDDSPMQSPTASSSLSSLSSPSLRTHTSARSPSQDPIASASQPTETSRPAHAAIRSTSPSIFAQPTPSSGPSAIPDAHTLAQLRKAMALTFKLGNARASGTDAPIFPAPEPEPCAQAGPSRLVLVDAARKRKAYVGKVVVKVESCEGEEPARKRRRTHTPTSDGQAGPSSHSEAGASSLTDETMDTSLEAGTAGKLEAEVQTEEELAPLSLLWTQAKHIQELQSALITQEARHLVALTTERLQSKANEEKIQAALAAAHAQRGELQRAREKEAGLRGAVEELRDGFRTLRRDLRDSEADRLEVVAALEVEKARVEGLQRVLREERERAGVVEKERLVEVSD